MKKLLILAMLMSSAALANSWSLGVTYHPWSVNGAAVGVQGHVGVLEESVGGLDVGVGFRVDALVPLSFDLMPSGNVAVQVVAPLESFSVYAGTGVGVWVRRVSNVPCYDVVWSFHAGVDVPVWESVSVRADVVAAPLVGGWSAGLGLAYALPAR